MASRGLGGKYSGRGGVRNGEASFQAAATAPYYVRVVIDENEGDANGVRQLSPMHDAFIYLSRNR